MKTVHTTKAAQPLGHYAQAVIHDRTVYISTQLGITPSQPDAPPGTIEAQARAGLNNIAEILTAAGSSLNHIVRVTIYLSDIAHWDTVNAVYAEFLGAHRPARGVIPCGKLHRGYDVAFDVTAALTSPSAASVTKNFKQHHAQT